MNPNFTGKGIGDGDGGSDTEDDENI